MLSAVAAKHEFSAGKKKAGGMRTAKILPANSGAYSVQCGPIGCARPLRWAPRTIGRSCLRFSEQRTGARREPRFPCLYG